MHDSTPDPVPTPAPRTRGAGCPRQEAVVAMRHAGAAAAASGLPPEERAALEAHLAGCDDCRRALRVDGALALLAAEGAGVALPDPGRLFWRARILERLAARGEAEERAARPLRWIYAAAGAAVALLAAFLLTHLWGDLQGTLDVAARTLGGDAANLLQLAAWSGLALLAGAALLAAHTLVEER